PLRQEIGDVDRTETGSQVVVGGGDKSGLSGCRSRGIDYKRAELIRGRAGVAAVRGTTLARDRDVRAGSSSWYRGNVVEDAVCCWTCGGSADQARVVLIQLIKYVVSVALTLVGLLLH